MKTAAAVTMLALTIALAGCATTAQAAPQKPATLTMYETVWESWDGTDRPDEGWIDTAAMLACKQIIGGHEPRIVDHPGNNEIVVSAAEQHLCEIDR